LTDISTSFDPTGTIRAEKIRQEKTKRDTTGIPGNLEEEWGRILGILRSEVGEAAFRSWLQPVTVAAEEKGEVSLAVPTRFIRDWIAQHYADRIRELWAGDNSTITAIDLIVVPGAGGPVSSHVATPSLAPEDEDGVEPSAKETRPRKAAPRASQAKVLEPAAEDGIGGLDPRATFENFVVGKPNEFAHAAARRVAESENVPFNPLFLYGGVGLGKTHLMHAIAWQIRKRRPARKVLYLSAEQFMYRFIRALRYKDTMAFKEQFRSVDVLMIDDIQFICGNKDSTQEEFFHTFNALVDQNRLIVISADKSPSDLEGMEERLRSRLGWGLVADIHPTTYELRLGILQAKIDASRLKVPPKVMEFLAHKITSNVRELEGALNRIVAHADLVGRPVTIETTQELLRDLLRANDRRVTIDEIQRKVAEHFNMRVADMHSERRARAVARPRQVAMFLAKQLTQRSLPEIGRKFGGRDHTTVMHAVRKVEELMASDQGFAEDIELLRRTLGG
jgi:chromosomal replication initiator protein